MMNELNSYEKEKTNKSSRIKIGKEIPNGGVNMAYVHTPDLKVDEAISLIDTSYVSDNIIPSDQIESTTFRKLLQAVNENNYTYKKGKTVYL